MTKTKVDFANVCADARMNQGTAVLIEYDREVMFCQGDGVQFYMYFDGKRWHECTNLQMAWDLHAGSLRRNPPA